MKPSLITQLSKLAARGQQLTKLSGPLLRSASAGVGKIVDPVRAAGKAAKGAIKGTLASGALGTALTVPSVVGDFRRHSAGFKNVMKPPELPSMPNLPSQD